MLWQAYLRRFDLEHTFRFLKSQLGWTRPLLRDPAAADRWTWLLLACHAQLYLARALAAALRLPWQRPQPPRQMTPGRVRAGFRHARETAGSPASASETRQARPRTSQRVKEQAQGTPPPRRQDATPNPQPTRKGRKEGKADRLNGK